MNRENFLQLAETRHLYRVEKKLPGELQHAEVGTRFYSETLYDLEYNILQMVADGYLVCIDEPFEWQKKLVGENINTVYSRCPECASFGVNMPLDNVCGNCGYPKCITYYDAQTINERLMR